MITPRPDTIAAWTALLTTSRVLLEQVEAALKQATLPSLAWYDALLEIEKAGAVGLRPYELKDRLLLPQYGTSRLLDRIAAAGLIEKVDCLEDGRGFRVVITPEGQRIRRTMWPIYAERLHSLLEAKLNPDELTTLATLLRRTGDRVG